MDICTEKFKLKTSLWPYIQQEEKPLPEEFLRLILAVHNPVFRASQLGVLIEHLYIEF